MIRFLTNESTPYSVRFHGVNHWLVIKINFELFSTKYFLDRRKYSIEPIFIIRKVADNEQNYSY